MNSAHKHRRPRKIRRTGRHTRPSQLQQAADMAGKAAPAAAIAGVLVTAGPAHAAVKAGPAPQVVAVAQVGTVAQASAGTQARPAAQASAGVQRARTAAVVTHVRSYTVRAGDTLSSIAQRFYGNPADWRLLYQANRAAIPNPNVIRPGQVLKIPSGPAAPRSGPARAASGSAGMPAGLAAHVAGHARSALSGTLSCHGLEELWDEAGGSPAHAEMAAAIAMAESSGEQFATGAAGERGYWQIHPDHGALSTYDPIGNAHAAVAISADGTNWTPWTTFLSGAYHGRC